MENDKKINRGDGLIDPQKDEKPVRKPKKISTNQDGLMEREEDKIITEDGRELLKEN